MLNGNYGIEEIIIVIDVHDVADDGSATFAAWRAEMMDLPSMTDKHTSTLVVPQLDHREENIIALLVVLFPSVMRPDVAIETAAKYLRGDGYKPADMS